MEKLKNLCGQIPEELHNKVRTEQESLGLTLGKYLEQVLTAHFAAPASADGGGRSGKVCGQSHLILLFHFSTSPGRKQ